MPDKFFNIDEVVAFAVKAHDGQKRDDGKPYITHPLAVCMLMCLHQYSAEHRVVALLHDVVEDDRASIEDIEDLVGVVMMDAVATLTKPSTKKNGYKKAYYDNIAKNPIARDVKVFDRIHNLLTMKDSGWTNARKKAYLEDTKKYVLPLAKKAEPPSLVDGFISPHYSLKMCVSMNEALINGKH